MKYPRYAPRFTTYAIRKICRRGLLAWRYPKKARLRAFFGQSPSAGAPCKSCELRLSPWGISRVFPYLHYCVANARDVITRPPVSLAIIARSICQLKLLYISQRLTARHCSARFTTRRRVVARAVGLSIARLPHAPVPIAWATFAGCSGSVA